MLSAKLYYDDTQHLVNLAALLDVFSLMFPITDNHLAAVRKTGLSDYKELACNSPYTIINSGSLNQRLMIGRWLGYTPSSVLLKIPILMNNTRIHQTSTAFLRGIRTE